MFIDGAAGSRVRRKPSTRRGERKLLRRAGFHHPHVCDRAGGRPDAVVHDVLIEVYVEDEAPNTKGGMDKRTVSRLDPRLAPVKVAVLPLSRHADLSPKARDLAAGLRDCWDVEFDDAGAIGRRYRRQDEIGTPFCVTTDFDTLDDVRSPSGSATR
jgi:glycyl-tRNA synthetase